ncbi:MAG: hypothetical protein IJ083_08880 [Clostridia bacterium]|nr:hypothetical protein [Clostridia bacterium]
MRTYEEIVRDYRKRQKDTMVDTLAMGLTYVDEIAVDTGLLEETGLMTDLTSGVMGALPFVIIAATEGTKVILGRKPAKNGGADAARRMLKTGAAMGVGAAVAGVAGFWAALPATMGVRALFDTYKSRTLTGKRVECRIQRLQQLRGQLDGAACGKQQEEQADEGAESILFPESPQPVFQKILPARKA